MRYVHPSPEEIEKMLKICQRAKIEGKRVIIWYKAPHLMQRGDTSDAHKAGGEYGGKIYSINEHVMQVNIIDSQGNLESVSLDMVVGSIEVYE